jgi:hypothetical protein
MYEIINLIKTIQDLKYLNDEKKEEFTYQILHATCKSIAGMETTHDITDLKKALNEVTAKSEEEVTKSEEEVTKSEEEVTKSEEEVTKSEEEVTKSEEEVTKSEEEVRD